MKTIFLLIVILFTGIVAQADWNDVQNMNVQPLLDYYKKQEEESKARYQKQNNCRDYEIRDQSNRVIRIERVCERN